ncbi:DNA-directed RNA polymerase [Wickerhamomyces ciferrii]|uniref:DNA-directed RNA polymerase n=1 Tax=Wickerhamomyces ciferrii (strain ATCC 14091 / BCRC 22168 / CBS 111 / JCM 3599 / NBRC 0793 / NRRL Y-1031 F-60-10) TaxID=1206466 RepID=K0K8C5_WICCF|nr:DNA-directed RNA polymerase [Wickerhamomyces ciferrii]CCH41090.1 DNA-directed RNA polymerase [Wickerhamomyces ciferrii]
MSVEEPVKDVDVSMQDDEEQEEQLDTEKIKILPGATEDGTAASFQILDEDHTLGNALRYIIMKNPDVEFCGYSIPHPSETKLNIRIQTYGDMTAVEALHKGLDDLSDMCTHIEDKFAEKINKADYPKEEP